MANELTQSGTLMPRVGESSSTNNSLQTNIARCIDSMRSAPDSAQGAESLIILSIPVCAVLTVTLPSLCTFPMTRFFCAGLTVISLAAFVLCRLSIVQSMPKQMVYAMLGMLMATFLFGLALALMLSEGIRFVQF